MTRKRSVLIASGAIALLALARPFSAEVNVLTHDSGDLSPHRVRTAVNLGIVALDVLVTWSDGNLR